MDIVHQRIRMWIIHHVLRDEVYNFELRGNPIPPPACSNFLCPQKTMWCVLKLTVI